ncbi:3-ketoacyl-ACP reductase [Caryophanon latum]|uniref:3-ketoacyl-ACP reductase n=1 Tax=Caryophanon latum TaxID=33977 RepID=A0A1C0YUM0_9BACL|nr:3-ketoacyl-ACP reductase [Caryophanon latum]OCS90877.1 3-ketoacyl-ACP reductase [Caryophanon latum]
MTQTLAGKTAIITGAARGIGRAVAEALAKEGVHVGLIARTESHLQQAAEALKAYNVNVAYVAADVSNIDAANEAIATLKEQLGDADILINNAGICEFGTVLDMDPQRWKEIIDVNLFGTYNITRAVLPQLIEKNAGDIINISSTSGLSGAGTSSAYSASKFAVIGFSESLAQEVRRNNIRVSALAPSTIVTELATYANLVNDDKKEQMMHPADLAQYIVAQLQLPQRMYVKMASFVNTNPF